MANETDVRHVIRFPPELYAKLRELAKREDRSINSQVIASVRQAVEQYEREHSPLS